MEKLNVGLVGYGGWGKRHYQTLRSIPQIDLVGVFDPKYRGAGFERSLAGLIRKSEAVDVVVPPRHLVSTALKALKQGRHVFVEKPMAVNFKEGRRLLGFSKSQKIMVGFLERFNPVFRALRRILQRAEPEHIFCQRSGTPTLVATETGAMKDLAIHDLDLLCWMLGPPTALSGAGYHKSKMGELHLRFNSAEATIVADCLGPVKIRRWVVETRRNTYTAIFQDQRWNLYLGNKLLNVPWALPLSVELNEFARSVLQDFQPSPNVDDGIRALRIIESTTPMFRDFRW
jgi:predicted dehydrogenase